MKDSSSDMAMTTRRFILTTEIFLSAIIFLSHLSEWARILAASATVISWKEGDKSCSGGCISGLLVLARPYMIVSMAAICFFAAKS
jgi:hypothetical protein